MGGRLTNALFWLLSAESMNECPLSDFAVPSSDATANFFRIMTVQCLKCRSFVWLSVFLFWLSVGHFSLRLSSGCSSVILCSFLRFFFRFSSINRFSHAMSVNYDEAKNKKAKNELFWLGKEQKRDGREAIRRRSVKSIQSQSAKITVHTHTLTFNDSN